MRERETGLLRGVEKICVKVGDCVKYDMACWWCRLRLVSGSWCHDL